MSWSVSAVGKPAAVKARLNEEFKRILEYLATNHELKHEHASAALAQESIEAQLNFVIENELHAAVRVAAHGSAYLTTETREGKRVVTNGNTDTHLSVELIHGFLE